MSAAMLLLLLVHCCLVLIAAIVAELMSGCAAVTAIAADVYYRCDVDAPPARCRLLSELDAAGHADALQIPLLLSSNAIAADIKLDQRPHIGDDISKGDNTRHITVGGTVLYPQVVAGNVELSDYLVAFQA
jgi:hypothetical protein